MKKFKLLDGWVSVGLIVVFFLISIIKQDISILAGYFVIGGWQLISMLVHTFNGWFMHNGFRFFYHMMVLVILLLGAGSFIVTELAFIYYIMLFAAPLLAVTYTILCFAELKNLHKPAEGLVK